MNTKDTASHQCRRGACVVCGEIIDSGQGRRINHRGSTVTLCGPLCLRRFAKEPDVYIDRMARAMQERKSRRILVRLGDRGLEGYEGIEGAARSSQAVAAEITTP